MSPGHFSFVQVECRREGVVVSTVPRAAHLGRCRMKPSCQTEPLSCHNALGPSGLEFGIGVQALARAPG
jgi:hypothetical protein